MSKIGPRFRKAYTAAAAVIAVVAAIQCAVISGQIAHERSQSARLNMAGRERLLAERIALSATRLYDGGPATAAQTRPRIDSDIAEIARNKELLVAGGASGTAAPIAKFAAKARAFAGSLDGNGRPARVRLDRLVDDAQHLIVVLDTSIAADVAVAERHASTLIGWETASFAALLVTLLLELRLIFNPLVLEVTRSERRLELLMADLPVNVWAVDAQLVITSSAGAGLAALGYRAEAVIGMTLGALFEHDPECETLLAHHRAALAGEASTWQSNLIGRIYQTHVEPQRNAEGRIVGVVGCSLDVTEQAELSRALHAGEAALSHAQATARLGSWEADLCTGRLTVSRELRRLLGIAPDEGPLPVARLRAYDHPDEIATITAALAAASRSGEPYCLDRRIVLADGSVRWLQEQGAYTLGDGKAIGSHGTLLDITERKAAEEQLLFAASHDMLTALPNRAGLASILSEMLTRKPAPALVAAFFVDVTGYAVNETLGFAGTDEFIALAARRLVNVAGGVATVGRFNSDQFVVVCDSLADFAQTRDLGQRIVDAFALPLTGGRSELFGTVSVGIDTGSGPRAAADTLIFNANTAMLEAKAAGRNVLRFFTTTMYDLAVERVALEADLRRAVGNEQLAVHYQPLVTSAGRVIGFEALSRWSHEVNGNVPPDRFIPIAEQSGLIVTLGAWVLRRACTELHLLERCYPGARVAVNISTRQLQEPDFEATVRRILTETATRPDRLELEITESVIMDDVKAVLPVLTRLRSIGVRISLDDFGTGYSSLSYLKHLPVDTLKIDKSFVNDISADDLDGAIAQAIVALAHSLGLIVIAEGVETETQRAYLEYLGCDEFQGYLFSRPLTLQALLERPLHTPGRPRLVPVTTQPPASRELPEIESYARRA